jgi:hypothetical protein
LIKCPIENLKTNYRNQILKDHRQISEKTIIERQEEGFVYKNMIKKTGKLSDQIEKELCLGLINFYVNQATKKLE